MAKNPLGPLPDAAQIIQYVMSGTKNGYLFANVGYLQYAGTAPAVSDLNAIGTAIGNAWGTNYGPLCGASVTMNSVSLVDLTSRGAAISSVTGLAKVGSRAGTDVPNNVAAVISWKINRRYRGGHPRTYLPAGMQADITTGRLWTTAFQTAVTAAAGAFRTALNGTTYSGATMKMVSMGFFTHDPTTHRPVYIIPPVPYTIQSGLAHGRVDTQRRRLGKETP